LFSSELVCLKGKWIPWLFLVIGFEETYSLSFRTANQKGIAFVQILIISVTVIVVAVPEGM